MFVDIIKKNKIISFFSIIMIILTLVLSTIYFSFEIGHSHDEYDNNDCPICLVLSICKNNIDNIKCGIGGSFNIPIIILCILRLIKIFNYNQQNKTLVSMKIRLND